MVYPLLAGEIAEAIADGEDLESLCDPTAFEDVNPADVAEHIGALLELEAIAPGKHGYEAKLFVTETGASLLQVLSSTREWLDQHSPEPIALESERGRSLLDDWFSAWDLLLIHQLVGTSRSPRELERSLPWIGSSRLADLIDQLESARLLEPCPESDSWDVLRLSEFGLNGIRPLLHWHHWLIEAIPGLRHRFRPEHFETLILSTIPRIEPESGEVPDGTMSMVMTDEDEHLCAEVQVTFREGCYVGAQVRRPTPRASPSMISKIVDTLELTLPEIVSLAIRGEQPRSYFIAPPPVDLLDS